MPTMVTETTITTMTITITVTIKITKTPVTITPPNTTKIVTFISHTRRIKMYLSILLYFYRATFKCMGLFIFCHWNKKVSYVALNWAPWIKAMGFHCFHSVGNCGEQEVRFTVDFQSYLQSDRNLAVAMLKLMTKWLLQNIAHVTTVTPAWHGQHVVAIKKSRTTKPDFHWIRITTEMSLAILKYSAHGLNGIHVNIIVSLFYLTIHVWLRKVSKACS